MEQKFNNLKCNVMTHDKWVSFSYIPATEINLAKTVFEFFNMNT